MQLYDDPVNMFVAGFIGSPSMNFIEGKLTKTYDGARFEAGGLEIALHGRRLDGIEATEGLDVVLGIRPEHIEDAQFAPSGAHRAVLEATADVVEPMGSETLLYVTAKGGMQVTAKVTFDEASSKACDARADLDKASVRPRHGQRSTARRPPDRYEARRMGRCQCAPLSDNASKGHRKGYALRPDDVLLS